MDFKASIETLPLELQEEIFEYVLHSGPKVNLIIRDAAVLQEENHFNVLPKNPPHPFARYVCSPRHCPVLPAIHRRRVCYNTDYEIPPKPTGSAAVVHTFALSLVYQISPIPTNVTCLSKNLQRAVVNVWSRLRRNIKKLLDDQIVLKDRNNARWCGSYKMIWYTDFVEKPSAEMLELVRTRCRLILDIDASFFAIMRTMREIIPNHVRHLVVPHDMVANRNLVKDLVLYVDCVGVFLKDRKEPPVWCLQLLADRSIQSVECIQPPPQHLTDTGEVTTTGKSAGIAVPKLSVPGYTHWRFTGQVMETSDLHDRGRYISNSFYRGDGRYYQGRETLEDVVTTLKNDEKETKWANVTANRLFYGRSARRDSWSR
ncbi:hypothetical protein ABW20_dc0101686 [Dactylellina cionopaga]|nr:hypothetical protein ABW20_dc0101686 [Dactylellina cionopaga]